MYLFFCQYHSVLITVVLEYRSKAGCVMPTVVFLFLRISLAVREIFCGSV